MFRTIVIIGLLQVLTILVQVVRAKVISVDLGPAGLGLVGLTDQLIILVGMVFALSLPTVAVRVMSRPYGRPGMGIAPNGSPPAVSVSGTGPDHRIALPSVERISRSGAGPKPFWWNV